MKWRIISECIFGKRPVKSTASSGRGRSYYRSVGILNMVIGFVGLMLFNYFLRDKGIIPDWSFWTGFAGFALFVISGMICIHKKMTSCEP